MHVFRCYGTQSRAACNRRNTASQVCRASPLAFSSIASQPRSFSYTPKMARSAKCAFCVAMALGRRHARQATGEILAGKSGLSELALLLSASSPVGPVTPPRSEPLHRHPVLVWRASLRAAHSVNLRETNAMGDQAHHGAAGPRDFVVSDRVSAHADDSEAMPFPTLCP